MMIKSTFNPMQFAKYTIRNKARFNANAIPSSFYSFSSMNLNSTISNNDIPSNLILADESSLKPIKKIDYKPLELIFPRINVPKDIEVHLFAKPNQLSDFRASISEKIFGIGIRKDIILDVIRYHLEKQRQPYKTKRKSEISGSNKKPFAQKGTGRAQAGHKRNAIWRGGHKAMGPVLRDFSININRKVRAQAMMIAIAAKYLEGNLIIFDNLALENHKTKTFSELINLHNLGNNQRVVFVDGKYLFIFLILNLLNM